MPRSAVSLLLAFAAAFAAEASIDEFAWQAPIAARDEPLQRVELPLEVVLALTRDDLGDVAVFNAAGKRLPHAVGRTPGQRRELTMALPFHEFSRFQQQQAKIVTARRQAREGDAFAELETTETVPVQTRQEEFLIDLRADADAPRFDRIELDWRHQPADQWLELSVLSGSAIDELRMLNRRKRLSNRDAGEPDWRSLGEVPAGHRYLLLSPATRVASFELLGATGHYTKTEPPPTFVHRVEVERIDENGTTFYRFDYPARVRAERLRLVPGDPHSVIGGDLYATWQGADERRLIVRDFRQHNIDSREVRPSEPILLPQRRYDQFWITTNEPPAQLPRVEFEYARYEVVFLGDGEMPYRLAWGNYASDGGSAELESLLDGERRDARERSVLASLGPAEIAGGAERLAAKPRLPWQKWLLWALLIAAAAVTGRMAFVLYREMNPADSKSTGLRR